MISIASKLIRAEWKPTLFFAALILSLSCVSVFAIASRLGNAVLFCIGMFIYYGYFVYIGKALKGEKLKNPYIFILNGKDKNLIDFIILLVLFSSILLLLKGPMILFKALFAQKLNELFDAMGYWYLLYQLVISFFYCAYFVALYSAISSMTYHKHEVFKSFKDGIKGVWRFRFILFIVCISYIGYIAVSFTTKDVAIHATFSFYFNLMPAAVMFMISCSYSLADTKIIQQSDTTQQVAAPNAL